MTSLTIALHILHLLFAIFWFGSLLYTELVLWPRLRSLGQLESVQGELRKVSVRKLMAISVVGTIVTGYARGVSGGVFERLFSPYGVMFVSSTIIGIGMMVWWASFPTRDRKLGWILFYSSFWVIFALMVGMRFNA